MIISKGISIFLVMSLLGANSAVFAADRAGAFYVGGEVGNASYDYSDIKNSTTKQYYIGYRRPDSILGFEAAYVDLGKADVTSLPGNSLNISGHDYSVVFHTRKAKSAIGYLFKLGYYSLDNDWKIGSNVFQKTSGSGLSVGGGLDYAMNRYLFFRAELQGFVGVKDFANNGSVFSGNLGLELHF
jgi:hypothetical protein